LYTVHISSKNPLFIILLCGCLVIIIYLLTEPIAARNPLFERIRGRSFRLQGGHALSNFTLSSMPPVLNLGAWSMSQRPNLTLRKTLFKAQIGCLARYRLYCLSPADKGPSIKYVMLKGVREGVTVCDRGREVQNHVTSHFSNFFSYIWNLKLKVMF